MADYDKVTLTLQVSPVSVTPLLAVLDLFDDNGWYDDMEAVEALEYFIDSFRRCNLSEDAQGKFNAIYEIVRDMTNSSVVIWGSDKQSRA
jgi:hypothetical protein